MVSRASIIIVPPFPQLLCFRLLLRVGGSARLGLARKVDQRQREIGQPLASCATKEKMNFRAFKPRGAHVFFVLVVVGVVIDRTPSWVMGFLSPDSALPLGDNDAKVQEVPFPHDSDPTAHATTSEDKGVLGPGLAGVAETSELPSRPRVLTATDVAFVTESLQDAALPKVCSAMQSTNPTLRKDTAMRNLVLETLQKMRTSLALGDGTTDKENGAAAELRHAALDKAIFLVERFEPDYSNHPEPDVAYHRAVLRYLKRALTL